jgi:hypothetical protein
MNNPFLQTIYTRLLYLSIWIILIIVQILFLSPSAGGSIENDCPLVLSDALICHIFLATCMYALWYPVRYYRNILNVPLFLLFHLSLLLIALAVWLVLSFSITRLILPHDPAYTDFFLTILPVRIFLGLLIYIIFALNYYLFLSAFKIREQQSAIETMKREATLVPEEKFTRISVKKKQEIHFISVNQILYIEANGDYVLIHTAESKYLKDSTMKYWETHLPDNLFVRIHRSFIINIEHVLRIELYEKDIYKIHLKNGNALKASIAGYKILKQRMQL